MKATSVAFVALFAVVLGTFSTSHVLGARVVLGGGVSVQSSEESASSEEDKVTFKEKVARQAQDRRWDNEDRDGGSTIVLQNLNSLEAHEEEQDHEKHMAQLRAQKKEMDLKRAEEDRGKKGREAERKKSQQQYDEGKKKVEEKQKKAAEQEAKKTAAKAQQAEEQQRKKREKIAAEQRAKQQHSIALGSNWKNYGSSWAPARVDLMGKSCMVEGLIRGRDGYIGRLPTSCRPSEGRLMFTSYNGHYSSRIDILRDGRMYFITGPRAGWVSLSGIGFVLKIEHGLPLGWSWRPYGGTWRKPSTQREGGQLCMLSGLIRSGRWNSFGRVSTFCRPLDGRLIFSACNHYHVTRIDVTTSGYFLRQGGYHQHGWVSLDGMAWSRSGGHSMRLYNGWKNYGYGYRGAKYHRIQNVCVLSGLIRGRWASHIATLPSGCRPAQRLIFAVNVHYRSARVDVLPNGAVHYVSGKSRYDWISLSGIKFVARK